MKRVIILLDRAHRASRNFFACLLAVAIVVAALPLGARPAGHNESSTAIRWTVPETVKVNRTVPEVEPVSAELVFSAHPADAEITRARVFSEPLLKTDEASKAGTSVSENQALAQSLLAYRRATGEDVSPLTEFLSRYPHSSWRASLLANLGAVYRHLGYFTKAIAVWEEAWGLTQDGRGRNTQAIANQVLGELAGIHTHLGHSERLESLFAEMGSRDLHGPTTEQITVAKESLWKWRQNPEEEFRCGPMSLARIREHQGLTTDPHILSARATRHGMSLAQVATLATQSGMKFQMARRQFGAPVIFPAVAHWKVDHFSAILDRKEVDGKEYYLVQNPLFEGETWISRTALDEETSGYFLVPQGKLPTGWQPISRQEGSNVWGRCWSGDPDTQQTTCYALKAGGDYCPTCPCQDPPPGMPHYSFHALLVSLNIMDTPVGYTPSRGPAVRFTLTYNQREAFQPSNFSFSNLGPKWTFNWLSYVTDKAEDINHSDQVFVYLRGGGREEFRINPQRRYGIDRNSQAELALTSWVRYQSAVYERRLPDGSKEVFGQPDGVAMGKRRVFLTQVVDPAGNSVKLTYDDRLRVVALTDAIGQVTTIAYELPGDPLKITRVTDPFGRTAVFSYDTQGRLTRITDVIGLTSEFTYVASDFISSLKTPYGTTSFRTGPGPEPDPPNPQTGTSRYLQATDSFGETERMEYWGRVPGRSGENGGNFYFNKRAWRETSKDSLGNPTNYTKAKLHRWMLDATVDSGVKYYEAQPLENDITYSYPKLNPPGPPDALLATALNLPTAISRKLDDGTTQTSRFQYNPRGHLTQFSDPAGRGFSFAYDANQIDLLEVYNDKTNEVLARLTYNSQHLPLTFTDAAGQTTRLTYNPQGQVTSATNAKGETTTFTYNANGYLLIVAGPVAGATTNFSYDGYGRLRTITDSEGYPVTIEYDALDRPTRTIYPDGTFEQITYDRLDATEVRDRLGRVTKATYDALRRLASVTDPIGRVTRMEWCNCGDLEKLIDPAGNVTTWSRDVQGRVTSKTLADGTQTYYIYEKSTSRLKQVIDAKGQVINYQYAVDDNLLQISFPAVTRPPRIPGRPRLGPPTRSRQLSEAADQAQERNSSEARVSKPAILRDQQREAELTAATVATPTVTFTWDPNYDRMSSFQDGPGTTTYSYRPAGMPGALQVAAVDGPLDNDTLTYSYDELGRVVNRAINGVSSSQTFDALGRVTNETNKLGTFTYAYARATGRLESVRYPNGQTAAFSYFDNSGDQRLKQIKHLAANQTLLSQFDYTYLATGEIQSVAQQRPASAPAQSTYNFSYDPASQLTGAIRSGGGSTLASYAYAYDPAGNRASEQINSAVTQAFHNNTNQLVRQQQGNQTQPFTYDANGSLLNNGARSFEWDAFDRLTAIVMDSHRTEFSYDALDRRTRIVEKENGVVVSDKLLVWCGDEICEERSVTGNASAVTKRFFAQGETGVAGGNEVPYFYTRDHLNSIRQMADGSGNVVANYDYDPYGRMTKVSGSKEASFGYANYYVHAPSGLNLTQYRAYDAGLGRWLSRDPIEEEGGLNLYAYVHNDPANFRDPRGLTDLPVVPEDFGDGISLEKQSCDFQGKGGAKWFRQRIGQIIGEEMAENSLRESAEKSGPKKGLNGKIVERGFREGEGGSGRPPGPRLFSVAPGVLNVLRGLIWDYDRFRRAQENGLRYDEQLKQDVIKMGNPQFLRTIIGPIPNPYYNRCPVKV